jgi:hypothetical protein
MTFFGKRVKKLDAVDLTLIKLSAMAFILFLITVWPALMNLVHRIHWAWFLAAAIILALRPKFRAWMK